jgi:hypothetical protein
MEKDGRPTFQRGWFYDPALQPGSLQEAIPPALWFANNGQCIGLRKGSQEFQEAQTGLFMGTMTERDVSAKSVSKLCNGDGPFLCL